MGLVVAVLIGLTICYIGREKCRNRRPSHQYNLRGSRYEVEIDPVNELRQDSVINIELHNSQRPLPSIVEEHIGVRTVNVQSFPSFIYIRLLRDLHNLIFEESVNYFYGRPEPSP